MAADLRDLGGEQVAGPRRMPWQAVELEARDPDAHVVVLAAPPQGPRPQGWDEFMWSTSVE